MSPVRTGTLRSGAPHLLPETGAGMVADRVVHDLGEGVVIPVAPGEPDQRERRWQQPPIGQVVHRGHQLLTRKITGDPKMTRLQGPAIRARRLSRGSRSGLAQAVVALRCAFREVTKVQPFAAASCSAVASSSSFHASSNLLTPSLSSTSKTSVKSIPRAAILSKISCEASPSPVIEDVLTQP